MADTEPRAGELTTVNYGWTKPTVGASDDAWGGYLNTDLDGIDATVHSVSGVANAAYPASNPAGYITAAAIPAPYVLPTRASTTVLGGVKVDGTTIKAAGDGTISTTVVPLGDNRIINGNFAVNQRGYVSGTALPASPTVANGYGHDRWKAGAGGCTYTFTAALPDTTITITANTLTQIIEAGMIEGGVYTLSWTGTAQARVYQGTPTGTYAASPIVTASLTAGTNTIVEFNTGSVGRVKFENGAVATPYNRQSLAKNLADCQRYYQVNHLYMVLYNGGASQPFGYETAFKATMRGAPTVTAVSPSYSNSSGITVGSITTDSVALYVTATAVGVANFSSYSVANAEL